MKRERNERRRGRTYRGSSIVSEPDSGKLTPTELPLSYVASGVEGIANPNGMVSAFSVRVDPLVVFLGS